MTHNLQIFLAGAAWGFFAGIGVLVSGWLLVSGRLIGRVRR